MREQIVVDASVIITALVDQTGDGVRMRAALAGHDLAAPAVIDLETASVLRGLVISGRLDAHRAQAAIADLSGSPIDRADHRGLLDRVWALRGNLTAYDAAYVALAELLEAELWTADARLAKAAGPKCTIRLFT